MENTPYQQEDQKFITNWMDKTNELEQQIKAVTIKLIDLSSFSRIYMKKTAGSIII